MPLGGHTECAETFWSRYASHYIYPHARVCSSIVPYNSLAELLPDFDSGAAADGRRKGGSRDVEMFARQAVAVLEQLLNEAASDVEIYLELSSHVNTYSPSRSVDFLLHSVLFPFQIYLFSQAEGDQAGERTESLILEGYLTHLLPICLRILDMVSARIQANPKEQPILFTSLESSFVDALIPYVLSLLNMGQFSARAISLVQEPLFELTRKWCDLLTLSGVDVRLLQRPHT